MSDLAPALAALQSGDRERAKTILVQAFDHAPGDASALLAKIAVDEGEYQRAEALARTALENFASEASITLADAIGRQGRRAEAEQLALDALSAHADSGLLRAVLGEQRIRQAKWDLGTQDYVDALSFADRSAVIDNLWRVTRDLTIGHRAQKVPTQRALSFLDRIESGASQRDARLAALLDAARRAINSGSVMDEAPPASPSPAPPRRAPPPPSRMSGTAPARQIARSQAPPTMERSAPMSHSAPPQPNGVAPDLVAAMHHDRELNERLQHGLEELGLPSWPSKNKTALDTIPIMQPKNLAIDREEFQREHLNVTSGSVASEIVVERALQALLLEVARSTAGAPEFNDVGLTKLELALWDGVLDRMRPIPQIYLAGRTVDARVLAIGAFLGACVLQPGDATWSFDKVPESSTIETLFGDTEPMDVARRWVEAPDKDDVHLEEFLAEVRSLADVHSKAVARHDPTEGLVGEALAMKLAALWTSFRMHPRDTAQNDVAAAIRPLNVLDDIVFFALGTQYAPSFGAAPRHGEVAVAYVRRSGEFLLLTSRKHFARAVGVLCKQLTKRNAPTIVDLFGSFHEPRARVFQNPARQPKIETRGDSRVLRFTAEIDGEARDFGLAHTPSGAIKWRLLEA